MKFWVVAITDANILILGLFLHGTILPSRKAVLFYTQILAEAKPELI